MFGSTFFAGFYFGQATALTGLPVVICLTGTFHPLVSATGSYRPAVPVSGQYRPLVSVTGTWSTCNGS